MPHAVMPVVLFVHGSWHSPAHFKPITDLFQPKGCCTVCPCLPPKPTVSLPDDAACIGSELKKLIEDEEEDVIVAMHSYGGVVGTLSKPSGANSRVSSKHSVEEYCGCSTYVHSCCLFGVCSWRRDTTVYRGSGQSPETRQHTLRNYSALYCTLIKWLTRRVWLAIVQHVPQLWWLFCRVVTVKASQNVNWPITCLPL